MEQSQDKTVLFESAPIPQAVAKLAIPTILTQLVMILYSMADTYFVGMLNDPVQNASVTLAAPVLLAFCAVTNLFGVGTSSLMSRALGSRDYEKVLRSSAFGFYCATAFSLVFSGLCWVFNGPLLHVLGADAATTEATKSYLLWSVIFGAPPAILNVVMAFLVRAEGSALHASLGTMSGCLLNILLDPIFILPWGLNMGSAGAGCATFLANCFALGYFLVLLLVKRGKTFVCVDPRKFCWNKQIVRGIFGVGIPASIQNLLNVTGMTILNNAAAAFGAQAVAAIGITQRIYSVPVQIAMGFPQGVMPLVSYNYASRNIARLKASVFYVLKLMLAVLLTMVAILYLFPDFWVSLFIADAEIIAIGARLLRGFSLGVPFHCIDFLAVNIFQAVGLGKNSLIFAVFRKIIFEIPFILLLNYLYPLYGLSYSQMAGEILMSILAVLCIRRIFRNLESGRM